MNRTSDYLEFDRVLNKGLSLLNDDKKYRVGFYLIISINTGLRISDVLNIRHMDLSDDKLIIREKKTQKLREITINKIVKESYAKLVLNLTNKVLVSIRMISSSSARKKQFTVPRPLTEF